MMLVSNTRSLAAAACLLMGTTNEVQGLIQKGSARSSLIVSPKDMSVAADKASLMHKKRTLYDLLGANPSENRNQLKKRYVAMAKLYHPDALRNSGDGDRLLIDQTVDFSEVAAAWKVLSNKQLRTRYDRTLRAEEMTESFLQWMDKTAEQTVPVVLKVAKAAGGLFAMFRKDASDPTVNHATDSQAIEEPVFATPAIEDPVLISEAIEDPVIATLTIDDPVFATLAIDDPVLVSETIQDPVFATLALEDPVFATLAIEEIAEPSDAFSSPQQQQLYQEQYNLYLIWYAEDLRRMTLED